MRCLLQKIATCKGPPQVNPLLAIIPMLPEKTWQRIRNRRLGKIDLREENGRLVMLDKRTGEVCELPQRRAMRLAEIVCQSISDRNAHAERKL